MWDAIDLFFYSYWGSSKVMALTTLFHLVSVVRIDWIDRSQEVKGDMHGCDTAVDYKNFEWK